MAQAAVFALYVFAPSWTPWDAPFWVRVLAWPDLAAGLWLALDGGWRHGRRLRPWIRPVEGQALVTSGSYRWVRHPIYAGIILLAWGWGWWTMDLTRLGLAVALVAIFWGKAAAEETMLRRVHPEYDDYARRTGRLWPKA